jgi:hypothetical protein
MVSAKVDFNCRHVKALKITNAVVFELQRTSGEKVRLAHYRERCPHLYHRNTLCYGFNF